MENAVAQFSSRAEECGPGVISQMRETTEREKRRTGSRAGLECGPAAPIAALSADELCSKVSAASMRESRQEEGA